MSISIRKGEIRLIDLATRLPFRYGIATMTHCPHAFVRMVIETDDGLSTGIAADHLPPKWFTKVPEQPLEDEFEEMLRVIEHAVSEAVGLAGETVWALWRELDERQRAWGRDNRLPSLLTNFGTTLVERAVIDAYCRRRRTPFAKLARENGLGMQLETHAAELAGLEPAQLLPSTPRHRLIVRQTVGMADPLEESDIAQADRLADGLPQSLEASIRRYGLKHFKVKISGDLAADVERLDRIGRLLDRLAPPDYALTLDGNEHFRELEAFRAYWQQLREATELAPLVQRLMFVEQPFHRDVALDENVLAGLSDWEDRPRMIIDESDSEPDSLERALRLGYHGTSHKNCKGVFRGLAHACLLERLRRRQPGRPFLMSAEDLANIGPVALLQDVAVAAVLGIASVERNGHHYFAGLSAFPESVQQAVLKHHGDLYEPSAAGWPTLHIAEGEIETASVLTAPFGVAFLPELDELATPSEWRRRHGR